MNGQRVFVNCWLLASLAIAGTLAGCGGGERQSANDMPGRGEAGAGAGMPAASIAGGGAAVGGTTDGAAGAAAPADAPADAKKASSALNSFNNTQIDRYLIKDAILSIETPDVKKAAQSLETAVIASGGYVSSLHTDVDGLGAWTTSLQVRVPASRFDNSVSSIEALGKVLTQEVKAEDVTEEFVDSQARLRNLKNTEARLLDHLSRTGSLSDTLLIEKELTRVREQIEEMEGHVKFLAHRIDFSTIDVTLKPRPAPQSVTPAETFSSGAVATDAIRSLTAFLQALWALVIWLAVWAVVWAPASLAGVTVYRASQMRTRHKV